MPGARKGKTAGGKYQGWYKDASGKQVWFTGTKNRAETKRIAERMEEEQRKIRLGHKEAPTSAAKNRKAAVSQIVKDYLAWGESQGGRDGRPWGDVHAKNRRRHLTFWQKVLKLKQMIDLKDCAAEVEKELQKLKEKGRSGKTLANYSESLSAFCSWALERNYLEADPLKSLSSFNTDPLTKRRAMTLDEINQLLGVCSLEERLLLETAFLSGLRAKELSKLELEHLDLKKGGLHLDAAWTKNRKPGFQPVPEDLLERLEAFARSGKPKEIYEERYRRRGSTQKPPAKPLLYVPSHTARTLDRLLEKAGIPKQTPAGKMDFHACRTAYITLVIESGATIKEAQVLARHSTADLTMNVYGRVREDRLGSVVKGIGQKLGSSLK